jgi:thioredoxin-related protein
MAVLAGLAWSGIAAAIDFAPSLDALKKSHPGDERPRVLIFGSQTCGWCRKLSADTLTSAKVAEIADRFLWVKADVDEEEELAATYGVRGLPHTAVIDAKGNVLGERPGYMPAQAFVDFLIESVEHPNPSGQQIAALLKDIESETVETRRDAIRQVMEAVSRVNATERDQTILAVAAMRPSGWAEFVPYLSHPRLAMRATAHGLLSRSAKVDLPFDPFAAETERDSQVEPWMAWIRERGASVPTITFNEPTAESTAWKKGESDDRPPTPPQSEAATP